MQTHDVDIASRKRLRGGGVIEVNAAFEIPCQSMLGRVQRCIVPVLPA